MNTSDKKKNSYLLRGSLARRGFVRWFHSFKGIQPQTGEERTFFIEYQMINPAIGQHIPVYGQHPHSKKRGLKPSYGLIKVGTFPDHDGYDGIQLNSFYPISAMKTCAEPFILQAGECFYSENRISGYVEVSEKEAAQPFLMSDDGYMEWDLEVHKAVACNMGFITGPLCTIVGALSSFWHAEGMRTFYKGYVSLNGVSYEVSPENSYGYADKNWGRRTNEPLLHLSSSHIVSELTGKEYKHSSFAVNGCFPKLLFLPLRRRLMIQLTYMGEDFEFHFARIKNMSHCKWKTKETNKRYIWHIKAENKDALIKISINCTKACLMELLYEGPGGELPKAPILAGSGGIGTIRIYKKSNGTAELFDTLNVEDALCVYSA